MKKIILTVLALTVALTIFVAGCASRTTPPSPSVAPSASTSASPSAATSGEKIFSAADLSKYDGKNGNPAYIAVDGVVYDVTNIKQWSTGIHQGALAGKDLTQAISKAPHGTAVLKDVPVVGKLQ